VSQKVAFPLKKLFAISLIVNLCSRKLPWLLPDHVSTRVYQCWSIYLNIYMNVTATSKTTQILTVQFSFSLEIHEIFNKKEIISCDIK